MRRAKSVTFARRIFHQTIPTRSASAKKSGRTPARIYQPFSFFSCSSTPAASSTTGITSSTAPLTAPVTAAETTFVATLYNFFVIEGWLLFALFLLDFLAADFFAPAFPPAPFPAAFLPPFLLLLEAEPFFPAPDFLPPPDEDFPAFLLAFLVGIFRLLLIYKTIAFQDDKLPDKELPEQEKSCSASGLEPSSIQKNLLVVIIVEDFVIALVAARLMAAHHIRQQFVHG